MDNTENKANQAENNEVVEKELEKQPKEKEIVPIKPAKKRNLFEDSKFGGGKGGFKGGKGAPGKIFKHSIKNK